MGFRILETTKGFFKIMEAASPSQNTVVRATTGAVVDFTTFRERKQDEKEIADLNNNYECAYIAVDRIVDGVIRELVGAKLAPAEGEHSEEMIAQDNCLELSLIDLTALRNLIRRMIDGYVLAHAPQFREIEEKGNDYVVFKALASAYYAGYEDRAIRSFEDED